LCPFIFPQESINLEFSQISVLAGLKKFSLILRKILFLQKGQVFFFTERPKFLAILAENVEKSWQHCQEAANMQPFPP
jgi:hypothetical protein